MSGTGVDGVAALRDLDDRLRGVPKPSGTRLEELARRLRPVYVEGAEEESRRREGRGLTAEELEGVLWRYPGDIDARRL
ncbi:MAG: hypothetical protein MUC54_03075 [Chloroflexi bacterium]|nr:hypothetical protein [Chloroflexota bacterium]